MATVMGILLACVLVFGFTGTARAATEWHIVLGEDTGNDEAVKVCLGDLVEAGRASGMDIRVAEDGAYTGGDLIVVGDGTRNPVTADLVREGLVSIAPMDDSPGIRGVACPARRPHNSRGGGGQHHRRCLWPLLGVGSNPRDG